MPDLRICRFGPCLTRIPGTRLYCMGHWAMIPSLLQHEIAEAWSRRPKALGALLSRAGGVILEAERRSLVAP
jgi:hypothetical protein